MNTVALKCRFVTRLTLWRPPSRRLANFYDGRVQNLLKKMTGLNLEKIFARQKEPLVPPVYRLMSSDELAQAEKETRKRAEQMLEMPPVVEPRKEIDEIISDDSSTLKGLSDAKYLFTDISKGSGHNRTTRIVVRESSGVLRQATWQERDRMCQIYFPIEGRKLELPNMLKSEHLPVVFEQGRHVDVLDLANVQCNSDSEDYIRIHHETYEDIDKRKCYDALHSTCHYGGMVFYLTSRRRIDGLLLSLLKRKNVEDGASLIKLFHILHPESESAKRAKEKDVSNDAELLQLHVEIQGPDRAHKYIDELEKQKLTADSKA